MTAAELKKWCEDRASVVLGTSGVFTPTGEEERLLAAMVVALEAALLLIHSEIDRRSIRDLIAELKEKP